ncbi:MAG TPA: alpha/beta hydrolase family protein [Candidatus Hydrogenedentes bacterium]|nr:alpha/beta hydrolase family protein [Candidatus Hydrogenedentota bacterium]HPG68764.1 alpha/beta hydrolase family protein [Candidatus Hydrogenedentota bacterium]
MRAAWLELLGPFPEQAPPLDAKQTRVDAIEGIECHHVTFQSEPHDRVTAYLLIPEAARPGPSPAVLCIHSTTHGSGKRRVVGLSGSTPEDPPDEPAASRAYGLELARWGYITLSIDLMCDGERIPQGLTCYDTSAFYERHPEWSAVGKNTWDAMRGIDFLETLDFVDAKRVGCVGHSLGGHSSLFTAAFDERVAAVVSNGGQLSWVRNTDHWSRPTVQKRGPVNDYVYIKRFRPYIEDPDRPVPVDFEHLMMMVAPRPMLISATEDEIARDDSIEKLAQAATIYRELGAGDRPSLFSFPGQHNYPPVAKRNSFNWLDRWLVHVPAMPTIWPGVRV